MCVSEREIRVFFCTLRIVNIKQEVVVFFSRRIWCVRVSECHIEGKGGVALTVGRFTETCVTHTYTHLGAGGRT